MDADDCDIEVNLPPELVARAEPLARARGMSVEELCRYLLEVGTQLREPYPETRAVKSFAQWRPATVAGDEVGTTLGKFGLEIGANACDLKGGVNERSPRQALQGKLEYRVGFGTPKRSRDRAAQAGSEMVQLHRDKEGSGKASERASSSISSRERYRAIENALGRLA